MYALLYASRARPGLLAADLNAIILEAQVRNRRAGITGLLLHGRLESIPTAPGEFIQWIEGDEVEVEALYRDIQGDPRHTDLYVLARGPIDTLTDAAHTRQQFVADTGRLFPSWSMGLVELADLPATLDGFLRFVATWNGDVVAQAA
jgi:hypothetical protein